MFGYNLFGYSSILELDRHQVQIMVPVITWQANPPTSAVAGGGHVPVPMIALDIDAQTPGISISANIYPPLTTVQYIPQAPVIKAGTLLEVGIQQAQYDLGGIGDTLLAEFSVGEGRLITKFVDRVPLLNMLAYEPADIQGGAHILLPEPVLLSLSLPAAEIDSRRRKLRVQVILS